MNEKVVSKTKMQLDEDFNIIDPHAEERKLKRREKILDTIAELGRRKAWLLEEVGELDSEMNELAEEYKSL